MTFVNRRHLGLGQLVSLAVASAYRATFQFSAYALGGDRSTRTPARCQRLLPFAPARTDQVLVIGETHC